MEKLKVSIITPTFNRGNLIEDTIESIINQEYKNIEYIVVDGKSTDNTIELLKKYKKQGHLQYVSEKDDGMYYAINKGIKMAKGDIIAYLNSDDRYFPWTVKKAVETFQKYRGIDMIFGDSYVIDKLKNKTHLNIYAFFKEYWLPLGGIICQPTVFLRKRIFEKIGYFNTGYKCLADCEFWQRVNSTRGLNILKVDEVMAVEYNHDDTIRHTFQKAIKSEKEKLMHLYGKEYTLIKCKLFLLRLYKESKLWKFVLINRTNNIMQSKSWSGFMSAYNASFNISHYFLRKLYVLPSFFKKVKKGERMV